MPASPRWTIDAYESDSGEKPAWAFIASLDGRDKAEAIALVKLLEELERPSPPAFAGAGCRALRAQG